MRVSSYLLFALSACCAGGLTAAAQNPSRNPLSTMLANLRTESAAYSASLPSISCAESIRVTSPLPLRARKIVEASAELSVRRDAGAKASPKEFRRFTSFNGRAPSSAEPVSLPILLNGGFVEGLQVFLSPEVATCMTYRLSDAGHEALSRINFARTGNAADGLCTRVMPGLTGFALIHPDGRHVQHVERTISPQLAALNHVASFTAIDYAPVQFGDESFWLPSHVVSYTGDKEITWDASYTGCHRYTVTATIVPPQGALPRHTAAAE